MPKYTFLPRRQVNIKNIIFDLGGVVLDIDYRKTRNKFKELGVSDIESIYTLSSQVELFNRLDCGFISPEGFRDELRDLLGIELSDVDIDSAWNALILDWSVERLNFIHELRNHYKVFLLSNTNVIHTVAFSSSLRTLTGGKDLPCFFEKVYYSYEVGMRKPDPRIFQLVLDENHLVANETLFIDDTLGHTESAKKLGLITYNIKATGGETITQLFERQ
ncbi:MAG: HAD family hydrolase [Bacteroidales bacterium]